MHNYVHHSTTGGTNIVDYGANFVEGQDNFKELIFRHVIAWLRRNG